MKSWNITRTMYKVSDFVSWQRSGVLELSPSFQRRPVWSQSAKSYLIDTIVRGFPIPIIFIREQSNIKTLEPKRQIVDGQQRIRTILSYVNPKSLQDYKDTQDYFQVKRVHNEDLSDKDFNDLPDEIKQRILDYQFSAHVLPSEVDDKQVLQIFSRMNSTGVKLNPQELRNATYFGSLKQTAYKLAYEQLERWREWGVFTENHIARMDEVELTSDFMSIMLKGISTKSRFSLDKLYKDYDDGLLHEQIIKDRFRAVMDSIEDSLGKDLMNLEFRNSTLFYYVFALIYDFHYSLKSKLIKSKKKSLPGNFSEKICYLNKLYLEGRFPKNIAESATRRTSGEIRTKVFNFLKSKF